MAGTQKLTDGTFEQDVLNSKGAILVDFWAEWCGPCRALGPKLEEIANELNGKVKILKLNVDENKDSAAKYGVRSIPMMVLFKDGEVVEQMVGNLPKDDIQAKINAHI